VLRILRHKQGIDCFPSHETARDAVEIDLAVGFHPSDRNRPALIEALQLRGG
jgi:hypothetical protein